MSYSTAISGAFASQKSLAVLSDNISNTSTTAYKSKNASFSSIYGSLPFDVSRAVVGNGVKTQSLNTDFASGSMTVTGAATDVAISGSAFFVTAPKPHHYFAGEILYGNYFTRDGRFGFDLDGYLVTRENYHVVDTDYLPIKLPTTIFNSIEASYTLDENVSSLAGKAEDLNNKTLIFSVPSSDVSLDLKNSSDGETLSPGDISFEGDDLYYVTDSDEFPSPTKLKIGVVEKSVEGEISVAFQDPTLMAPFTRYEFVDVEKEVEVEYTAIEQEPYTVSEMVPVEKVETVLEKQYLGTYSTEVAKFNSDNWTVKNSRFISGETLINGQLSPLDTTYGNPTSPVENDLGPDGSIEFSSSISPDGTSITLHTISGRADAYQTTKGPYIHTQEPISLKGNTEVTFDWNTEGSGDAYDIMIYLRNFETNETTIAVNETGQNSRDTKDGKFTFNVPDDGLYDIVIVGGTWDASGGKVAGANSTVSDFSFQSEDFQEQLVERTTIVYEARNVTKYRDVEVTKTRTEIQTVQELQEVTVLEDKQLTLPTEILSKIGKQLNAFQKTEIQGYEVDPLSVEVALYDQNERLGTHSDQLSLKDIKSVGEVEKINQFENLVIDTGGRISVTVKEAGNLINKDIATIALTNPISHDEVKYLRSGYYAPTDTMKRSDIGSIAEVAGGTLIQGSLERSNVDLMKQMTNLIQSQMLFNANSKAIEAYVQADKLVREVR